MAINRNIPPCPIGFNDEYRQRKTEPRYNEPTLYLSLAVYYHSMICMNFLKIENTSIMEKREFVKTCGKVI